MAINLHPPFKTFLNLLRLISSVKRWFGKLFQSLAILTKKEYLKELTLANLVCILYGWFACELRRISGCRDSLRRFRRAFDSVVWFTVKARSIRMRLLYEYTTPKHKGDCLLAFSRLIDQKSMT